jgi:hypothetical protein
MVRLCMHGNRTDHGCGLAASGNLRGLTSWCSFCPRQMAESFAEVSVVRGIECECPQAVLQIALP